MLPNQNTEHRLKMTLVEQKENSRGINIVMPCLRNFKVRLHTQLH